MYTTNDFTTLENKRYANLTLRDQYKNLTTINQFITANEKEIFSYFVNQYGGEVEKEFHYYYKKGSDPYFLIAHVDTWTNGKFLLVENNNILTNKIDILGADDRAGVYAIDKLLKSTIINPSILLTNWEERGGIGVRKFIKDKKTDFKKTKLFIELDMYGDNYCATYGCEDFIDSKYIDFYQKFGFEYSQGGYTDVYELSVATKIPNLNFSVCYHKFHTVSEYLKLDMLEKNIDRFKNMFENHLLELMDN